MEQLPTGSRSRGITLAELLVTLAILSLVVTLAIPSYAEFIARQRVRGAAELLYSAMVLTRSEAAKRSVRVTLCKASGGQCRDSGGWEQGWLGFVDPNSNGVIDPGEVVLMRQEALSGVVLTGNAPVRSYVSFVPFGRALLLGGGFQAGTLTACADRPGVEARVVVLSAIGRIRTATSGEECVR